MIENNTLDMINIIYKLQDLGYNIIRVFHPLNISQTERIVLVEGECVEAQGQLTSHTIVGVDITRLLQERHLSISLNTDTASAHLKQTIETTFSGLKSRRFIFSKDFSFELYK